MHKIMLDLVALMVDSVLKTHDQSQYYYCILHLGNKRDPRKRQFVFCIHVYLPKMHRMIYIIMPDATKSEE